MKLVKDLKKPGVLQSASHKESRQDLVTEQQCC